MYSTKDNIIMDILCRSRVDSVSDDGEYQYMVFEISWTVVIRLIQAG